MENQSETRVEQIEALMNGSAKRVLLVLVAATVVLYLVTAGLVVYSLARQGDAEAERATRAGENCLLFERDERGDIAAVEKGRRDLKATRKFIAEIPLAEQGTQFTRATISGLERQVADVKHVVATTDEAPSYCDRPGLGLPERPPTGVE